MPQRPIALTAGEPAGVGPDLCLALAGVPRAWPLVCLADAGQLQARARALAVPLTLVPYRPGEPVEHGPGRLTVMHEPLAAASTPGRLDVRNAAQVLRVIDRAVDGCVRGEFSAMVTAPVQKSLINEAGTAFSGHTEYIAARTGSQTPVMLLAAGKLRVALATTHLPLREVCSALSRESLVRILGVLAHDLTRLFGIARPRIAVCGVNPHAGEGGHLGDEELRTIAPAVGQARAAGLDLEGPLPADTLFVPGRLAGFDAVLAMYHDQGLPVLKYAGFGRAVNITLGLPIVRTSVDHGTALSLAGTGRADSGSLLAAVELAAAITRVAAGA